MKALINRTVLVAIVILLAAAGNVRAQYEPTWESLKTIPVPEWFDDAKFGIFIHWGAYSVIGHRQGGRGYSEHVPKEVYANPDYYYPYLEKRFGGHPPEFGYKDIVKRFKAEMWDPEAWAALFQESGAKYVILTGEHHDGYALWDSELTGWCATKVGPMRDLVGDLGKAVRARGLRFAPSYHRERHTGFFAIEKYAIQSEPRPDIAEEIRRHPEAESLYGPFSYTDEFIADYVARWRELQDKYRPDFMWIDDIPIFYKAKRDPQAKKFLDAFRPMIADYFNAAREWDKDVYVNNKGANLNWLDGPGCREKDNLNLPVIGPKWQNPATLGTSYGYMREEEELDAYKSPTALIHLLIDVVSKNGNLLLNIGPRADGTIPEGMQRRLLAIGKWLDVHGEAIYSTRHWKEYGEGPNVAQHGASAQDAKVTKKRRARERPYASESVRFTRSKDGNTLYAIQLVWPEDGKVVITRLGTKAGLLDREIKRVSLLGVDEEVSWQLTDDGLEAHTTAEKPNEHAYVWKIMLR
jgi:alpha-L-fucosidase